ncbi:MAG: SprT family zinc-dependent metalloprotease [Dehalogenimonas sp.]
MEIRSDATIVVRAPRRLGLRDIHRFIESHKNWITRKRTEITTRPLPPKKEFTEGEQFLVESRTCLLQLSDAVSPVVDLRGARLVLSAKAHPKAREAITSWYREHARRVIAERVKHYARIMACCPSTLRITSPRQRWGSCGPSNSLNFNWRLVMAPQEIIDYVVVHELAHIRHKHHSAEFWDLAGTFFPQYRAARRWLKDNGYQLDF